jgi:hypothetical protein
VVDSLDEYTRLADTYPQRYTNPLNPTCGPRWAAISSMEDRPFDAIHMTSDGASAVGGWDVESTLWFDFQFLAHYDIASISIQWEAEPSGTLGPEL